jgi:molybdopterin synthase sulfur carrier subunit
MPTVFIPVQLRALAGSQDRLLVEGATLRQLLNALARSHPELAARLWDGEALQPGLAATIDGAFASRGLLAKVGPASEVHFLPAIGGG